MEKPGLIGTPIIQLKNLTVRFQTIAQPAPGEGGAEGDKERFNRPTTRPTTNISHVTLPGAASACARDLGTPSTPQLRIIAANNPEARHKLAQILGEFDSHGISTELFLFNLPTKGVMFCQNEWRNYSAATILTS